MELEEVIVLLMAPTNDANKHLFCLPPSSLGLLSSSSSSRSSDQSLGHVGRAVVNGASGAGRDGYVISERAIVAAGG